MSLSLLAPTQAAVDPVDELRLLLGELQELVERQGLKEQSQGLSRTLKAAQDVLTGPRAVALLLGEGAAGKRRLLERLLGPVPELPECVHAACRLEYGSEPECVVPLPEGLTAVLPLHQVRDFLSRRSAGQLTGATLLTRLPSPALARGLAVIDTPPLALLPAASLAPLLEQTDVWLFVVGPQCTLLPETLALLRTLPDRGAQLEVLVEEGGGLTEAAAATAQQTLTGTLAGAGLQEARVARIAAGDGELPAAGLPATLLDRGRHRWLAQSRAALGEVLDDVESTVRMEVKLAGLGLRRSRLQRALKDLAALQLRFAELAHQEEPQRPQAAATVVEVNAAPIPLPPALEGTPMAAPPQFVRFSGAGHHHETQAGASEAKAGWGEQMRRLAHIKVRLRRERVMRESAPAPAGTAGLEAGIFRRPGGARPHSAPSSEATPKGHGWLLRGLGGALTAAFVCLLLWAFWPHAAVHSEEGSQWNYQPPAPVAPPAVTATPTEEEPPPMLPATAEPETQPTAPAEEVDAQPLLRPRAASRTPLAKPIPDRTPAGVARTHRRRDFLGLGKLWHWVRRGHEHKSTEE